MSKVRVINLAEKLGVETSAVLFRLKEIGIEAESSASLVDEEAVRKLMAPQPKECADKNGEVLVASNIIRRRAKGLHTDPDSSKAKNHSSLEQVCPRCKSTCPELIQQCTVCGWEFFNFLGDLSPEDLKQEQAKITIARNVWTTYQKGAPEFDDYLDTLDDNGLGEAVDWLKKDVERGIAAAQNLLGENYRFGMEVDMDDEEALAWFRKAAAQNYPRAFYNLGEMYKNGYGVVENEEEALKWYEKGANLGDRDSKAAIEEIRRSIEKHRLKCMADSGEIREFVIRQNGIWSKAQWLVFHENICGSFGKVRDEALGALLEDEKKRYLARKAEEERLVKERIAREKAENERIVKEREEKMRQVHLDRNQQEKSKNVRLDREEVELGHKEQSSLTGMQPEGIRLVKTNNGHETLVEKIALFMFPMITVLLVCNILFICIVTCKHMTAQVRKINNNAEITNYLTNEDDVKNIYLKFVFISMPAFYVSDRLVITRITNHANNGDLKSIKFLADIYENGTNKYFGFPRKNFSESIKWRLKEIEYYRNIQKGDSDAMVRIGDMYFNGKGVEQNKNEALKWYKIAAEMGDSKAQLFVHYMSNAK